MRSAAGRGGKVRARRAAVIRPGVCMKCERRLVKVVSFGRVSFVHEHSKALRCDPPPSDHCAECSRIGLAQCATPGCEVLMHPVPACSVACTCCSKLHCLNHADANDGICESCRAGHTPPDQSGPALDTEDGDIEYAEAF